jgi:hypothetical protein
MVLENICPPALLYLAFSIIQIIIDMYKGDTIQAFFKFIVMIIFTIVLNAICSSGMTIISWFIVFIPFILMTYVTTILFFIFGVNPSKIKPTDKKCAQTQFGCCPDGVTVKSDSFGRGCPRMRLADILKVPEPIPANSNDNQYLYHHGRSRYGYWIDGGRERYRDYWRDKRRSDWWRNRKINNWDSEYYNSKGSEKDKDKDKDNDKDTLSGKYSDDEIQQLITEIGKIIIETIKITKHVVEITKEVKAAEGVTNAQKETATKIEQDSGVANNEADDALILINSANTVDLVIDAKIATDKANMSANKALIDVTSLKTIIGVFKITTNAGKIATAVLAKTGITNIQRETATNINNITIVSINKSANETLTLINNASTFELSKKAKTSADNVKTEADKLNTEATALKTATGVV